MPTRWARMRTLVSPVRAGPRKNAAFADTSLLPLFFARSRDRDCAELFEPDKRSKRGRVPLPGVYARGAERSRPLPATTEAVWLPFIVANARRIAEVATLASWCSQILTTFHPAQRNAVVAVLSREMLACIFGIQYFVLVFGLRQHTGHPCQKQPSTNTTTLSLRKTKSGRIYRRPCPGLRNV